MSAHRKHDLHETGDAKMKAAAIRDAKPVATADESAKAVPSPARALQDQLQAHYQPLSQRMSVILISVLMAFAFIGGWIGGSGGTGLV